MNKIPQSKLKNKTWKPKRHRRQHHKTKVNKENHDWKEVYITIPQEPRLEKSQDRNQKGNQISRRIKPRKTHQNGIIPSNYNLITYLLMMWKILTAQIKEGDLLLACTPRVFPEA